PAAAPGGTPLATASSPIASASTSTRRRSQGAAGPTSPALLALAPVGDQEAGAACSFREKRHGADHRGLQGWRDDLQGWRDDLLRRRRPAVRALPRRGVGAARARRARAVREAVPR